MHSNLSGTYPKGNFIAVQYQLYFFPTCSAMIRLYSVFPTGQVGQAVAKPGLAYGNSLGPGLARAYRLCKA